METQLDDMTIDAIKLIVRRLNNEYRSKASVELNAGRATASRLSPLGLFAKAKASDAVSINNGFFLDVYALNESSIDMREFDRGRYDLKKVFSTYVAKDFNLKIDKNLELKKENKTEFILEEESLEFQELPNWVQSGIEERLKLGESPAEIASAFGGASSVSLSDDDKASIKALMLTPDDLTYEPAGMSR